MRDGEAAWPQEAWGLLGASELAQQVVDVHSRNQKYMASLDWHLYRHLHDCVTWESHQQIYPLVEVALHWLHHLSQKLPRYYFVIDSRLGRMVQVVQARFLEAASRQEQVAHLRREELLKRLLSLQL
jgi:hypothetical protein